MDLLNSFETAEISFLCEGSNNSTEMLIYGQFMLN